MQPREVIEMQRRRSAPLAIASVIATSLLLSACGGSGATTAANATPAHAATAASTATPASTPAATPAPTAAAASQSAGGDGLQYTGAGSALGNLTSYRFKIKVTGTGMGPAAASGETGTMTMDGIVVLKPQKAVSISMTGIGGGETGGVPMKYTIIGDRAWMEIGGTAMALPAGQTGSIEKTFDSLSPQTLFGTAYDPYLGGLKRIGDEEKNGVATIHLQADSATLEQLATKYGSTAGDVGNWNMDLWVAKDGGYMVSALTSGSYDMNGTRTDMLVSIDISGIDDPSNEVVAPA
ncbi:MAG: hypothetical protein M0Z49_07180 [Chloroflexi bacterium]|nr:hypothetical protein [Chloroflexota bacterium]